MKEFGLLLGILLAWFVLNRWVLPWLGVPTCMSGRCAIDSHRKIAQESAEDANRTGVGQERARTP